jgi:hypothetical protein
MNPANPFFVRDATGWQFLEMKTGRISMDHNLQPGNGTAGGPDMVKGSDGQISYAAQGELGVKVDPNAPPPSPP